MSNIFLISDHHLWHKNILTFEKEDGTPLRVFDDVNHMHEVMIDRHNSVVKPTDKVYFLGDVTMSRAAKGLEILSRFNGEKVLIKGNHDLCKPSQYLQYFKDIRAYHQLDGMVLSHIPIHPSCLYRWKANIHGHLHANVIKCDGSQLPNRRYINVCVEQLNYTPISLEEVKKLVI